MKDMFKRLFGLARGLQFTYQQIHWLSKNTISYQDHLLADRLYDSIEAEVDPIAEKSIGVLKSIEAIDTIDSLKYMAGCFKNFPKSPKENAEMFKHALEKELELINHCEECCEAEGNSLGFDNMLADIADRAEGRVYLLQQRLNK